jgi:DNA-binding CsgD family transcriptional regulator
MRMAKQRFHIALAEPSAILREGLSQILLRAGHPFRISHLDDLSDLDRFPATSFPHLIIINPLLLVNREKQVRTIKEAQPALLWAGLHYQWVDQKVLANCDLLIDINDNAQDIQEKLIRLLEKTRAANALSEGETLTEREREVLKALISGASNKEIAADLHISLHTVISHRKNITRKTSVKSLSGLTLYAITHKIISLDKLPHP